MCCSAVHRLHIIDLPHHGDDDFEAKNGNANDHLNANKRLWPLNSKHSNKQMFEPRCHDIKPQICRFLREDDAKIITRERINGQNRGETLAESFFQLKLLEP